MSAEQDLATANVQIANLISEVTRFRDAAMGLNAIYPTITEGRQNTADGKYFSVPGNGAYMRLYRRQGSSASLIAEYPSRESMVEAINEATADAEARANAAADRAEVYADNKEFVTRERLRKQATLDLDFASGDYALDDGDKLRTTNATDLLTVERATPKWVEGPNGKLREVPPNTIAREWRNGVPQWALIEDSRTNLHLYSADMTNAGVARQNCDITVSSEVSPIIGQSAFTFEVTTEGIPGVDPNVFSVVAGRKYTATVIAKAGTANEIGLVFKSFSAGGWQSGSVRFDGTVDASVGLLWTLEEQYTFADGWTFARVSCVADQDSNAASVQYRVTNDDANGAIGSTIHVAHWQVEEGGGSSIIPTTDSPVTRAADNVSRVLGDEFNPSEATFFFEFAATGAVSQLYGGYFTNSTISNNRSYQIYADRNPGRLVVSARGGASGAGIVDVSDVFEPGKTYKCAVTISSTSPAVALNGVTATGVGDSTGKPAAILLRGMTNNLGAPGMNCSSAICIPHALTEAELIELTS